MPQTRDNLIPTRMTDDETLRLDTVCRAKGLTRSSYVRMAVLERIERDEREVADSRPPTHPRKR